MQRIFMHLNPISMRLTLTFAFAAILLIFFGCHQPDRPANPPASRRDALIAALKELRGRILSGDKERIGRIFEFPVPDGVFNPSFSADSVFQVQYEKNGNMLTQDLFNAHFQRISGAAELEAFKGLFSFVNLDSLEHRDSIDVDTALANEGASRIYWIHINNDSIVDISYGTGHCQTVVPDTAGAGKDTARVVKDTANVVSGDDSEEDDPSACEHTAIWEFSFDGKKLRLLRQTVAD